MTRFLDIVGNVLGLSGIALCIIVGGARVLGGHYFWGFESMTLFTAGIALMVAACLAKVQSLAIKT